MTANREFDLKIVISQNRPLDASQEATLKTITADNRTSVLINHTATFNYAQANNRAIAESLGDIICLLNDDVMPVNPYWLDRMLGHVADPTVGAVGAKLYYPNNTIQHAGVVLGQGGLAGHINRSLPRDASGYAYRAVLSQELSAVTGACLLVPRRVFEAVGGLDESYPIAYNDIDFCLRIAEAGWSIIFCADAELFHFESLSLGRHYAGDRADMRVIEARRFYKRWGHIVRADPFHNPNLSLETGREWDPAFPPRVNKAGVARVLAL